MAADMHIHVLTDKFTAEDFKLSQSNVFGSKHFNLARCRDDGFDDATIKMIETPNVWVGQLSTLKAALSGDPDSYIPDPVGRVGTIIGEDLPVIDDKLVGEIRAAFELDNATSYNISNGEEVIAFLESHRGACVFTVNW